MRTYRYLLHQDDLIRMLKEKYPDLNVENIFWELRRLKAEGKITQQGQHWKIEHPQDKESGDLTQWFR